jgi:hypothetical protein
MKDNEASLQQKKSAVQDNKLIANEKKVLANIEKRRLANLVYEMAKSQVTLDAWKLCKLLDLKVAYTVYCKNE